MSFIPGLHEGTLHTDRHTLLDWITTIMHALPVPVFQESEFVPKQVVVPRLHGSGIIFRTGMRLSLQYGYRDELVPVELVPA